MDKTGAPLDVSTDVLHIPTETKLTQEQIAKAVAHHNRHHHERVAETGKTPQQQKSKPAKKMR